MHLFKCNETQPSSFGTTASISSGQALDVVWKKVTMAAPDRGPRPSLDDTSINGALVTGFTSYTLWQPTQPFRLLLGALCWLAGFSQLMNRL